MFIYFIIFLYIGIRIHVRKHIHYIDHVSTGMGRNVKLKLERTMCTYVK